MPKLPALSGKDLIKILVKIGYSPARQNGSHVQLTNQNKKPVTVPLHPLIGKGLLRKIMRDTELSLENLLDLLNK